MNVIIASVATLLVTSSAYAKLPCEARAELDNQQPLTYALADAYTATKTIVTELDLLTSKSTICYRLGVTENSIHAFIRDGFATDRDQDIRAAAYAVNALQVSITSYCVDHKIGRPQLKSSAEDALKLTEQLCAKK